MHNLIVVSSNVLSRCISPIEFFARRRVFAFLIDSFLRRTVFLSTTWIDSFHQSPSQLHLSCGDDSWSSLSWMLDRQRPSCVLETEDTTQVRFSCRFHFHWLEKMRPFNGVAHEGLSRRFLRRIIWDSSSLWWYFLLWANFDRLFERRRHPKVSQS